MKSCKIACGAPSAAMHMPWWHTKLLQVDSLQWQHCHGTHTLCQRCHGTADVQHSHLEQTVGKHYWSSA